VTRWGLPTLLLVLLLSPPALARVSEEEVARAAADVERARTAAGEAGAAWRAASVLEQQERVRLQDLIGEVAARQLALAEARGVARERARILYVTAGARGGGGDEQLLRATYAAAIGRADREALNALRAALEDLERCRGRVRALVATHQSTVEQLAGLEAATGPALVAAEAEYQRLRTAWELQEAARLQQERELRASTLATLPTGNATDPGDATPGTSAPATTTTTTTVPGSGSATFAPAVERWRALVAAYFPAGLVDQALAVIACESLGDPAVVNPLSGTAGLFQHHPLYWPERAAAAGFPGEGPDEPEANVAAAAWLVAESVASGLEPWFFWACRP